MQPGSGGAQRSPRPRRRLRNSSRSRSRFIMSSASRRQSRRTVRTMSALESMVTPSSATRSSFFAETTATLPSWSMVIFEPFSCSMLTMVDRRGLRARPGVAEELAPHADAQLADLDHAVSVSVDQVIGRLAARLLELSSSAIMPALRRRHFGGQRQPPVSRLDAGAVPLVHSAPTSTGSSLSPSRWTRSTRVPGYRGRTRPNLPNANGVA